MALAAHVGFAGAAMIGACAASPAAAESQPLAWRGVRELAILCQAVAAPPVDNQAVTEALCRRAAAVAGAGAPIPVRVVGYSDRALQTGGAMSLLIHAAVDAVAPGRLGLILTARTVHPAAIEPSVTFFGATPRVAPFTSVAAAADWDAALRASLGELLPWLRQAGTGELSPIKAGGF